MKCTLCILAIFLFLQPVISQNKEDNKDLATLFKVFNGDGYRLFPLQATSNGGSIYNDRLPVTFTDSYNAKVKEYYTEYLDKLKKFDRKALNQNDKLSYDVFKYNLEMGLEGLKLKLN
ncbi:MAG: hypothetical protein JWQ30_1614, partial [Sediminibacterium sp.]|nr:hypothetical protein [Sediminibacterium sp.]